MSRVGSFIACFLIAVSLGMVALSLASRDHPVVLPLDDAYIYLQYARTAVEGSLGAYAPGEEISTGATSLFWSGLLILAGGLLRVLGVSLTTHFPTAALVLSTIVVGVIFCLAYRLARRHGVGLAGAVTPLMILLVTPYWFFSAFNAMETGLYGAALLGGAWALCGGSVWWLIPLTLARPEGAILALVLLVVIRIRNVHDDVPSSWSTTLASRMVPVVVAAALLGPLLLSGQTLSAWEAKAVWTEPDPELRRFHLPRLPWFAARILLFEIQGARPTALTTVSDLVPSGSPGTLMSMIFLGGGSILTMLTRRGRGLLLLWILASLGALAALAWDAHFYRYVMPAYPLLAVTAAVGWFGRSSTAIKDNPTRLPRSRHLLPLLGGLFLLGLVVLATTGSRSAWNTTRRLYRGQCEQLAETQVRLGDWISRTLPGDARVATHDVGAIAFHGKRPVVDLVGLVTPEMSGAYRQGEGAIWEALEALPADRRPTHAAVIPAWMPTLTRSRWAGRTVWKERASRSRRSPVSRTFEVWELSWPDEDPEAWPGGNFGHIPRGHGIAGGKPGWVPIDALDVADLTSESAHDLEGAAGPTVVRTFGFDRATSVVEKSVAVDGGRDIQGPISFSLRAGAGLPALLVLRCTSIREETATVRVGEWSGDLKIPRGEDRFLEPALWIPPQALAPDEKGRVRIQVAGAEYRAFHWWLLQPDSAPE